MTVYYLETDSDDEVRALSCGIVPDRFRDMARAMLGWELDLVKKADAEQRIEDAKATPTRTRKTA